MQSEIPDIRINNESVVNESKIVNLEEHFKTINGNSILGSGDITIAGSGDINLSDYATKEELDEVENGLLEHINTVQSEIPDIRINNESIVNESKVVNLSDVARSGAYADLEGKPTIPTLTSSITSGDEREDCAVTPKALADEIFLINNKLATKQDIIIETFTPFEDNGVALISTLGANTRTIITKAVHTLTVGALGGLDNVYAEYYLAFKTNDVSINTFSFPEYFRWLNGVTPTIEAGTFYELSVTAMLINGEYEYKAILASFK